MSSIIENSECVCGATDRAEQRRGDFHGMVLAELGAMESLLRTLLHAVAERDIKFDPRNPTMEDAERLAGANAVLRQLMVEWVG